MMIQPVRIRQDSEHMTISTSSSSAAIIIVGVNPYSSLSAYTLSCRILVAIWLYPQLSGRILVPSWSYPHHLVLLLLVTVHTKSNNLIQMKEIQNAIQLLSLTNQYLALFLLLSTHFHITYHPFT